MAKLSMLLLAALAATADARTLAPAASKALTLRGGSLSGVSLCAAATPAPARSKKAMYVLGANAFVSTAYGVLSTLKPNAMLAIFGVTETLGFMSPAFGVAQYLGGLHLAVAFRCLGAFGVPGFPSRDTKEALQDMCALHTIAAGIAGFRRTFLATPTRTPTPAVPPRPVARASAHRASHVLCRLVSRVSIRRVQGLVEPRRRLGDHGGPRVLGAEGLGLVRRAIRAQVRCGVEPPCSMEARPSTSKIEVTPGVRERRRPDRSTDRTRAWSSLVFFLWGLRHLGRC